MSGRNGTGDHNCGSSSIPSSIQLWQVAICECYASEKMPIKNNRLALTDDTPLSVCLLECLVVEQSLPTLYQHWQMLDQYQYPVVSECPPCPVLCHHSLVVIIAPSLSPSFLSYFNCVMSHRAHILKHTHTVSFSCLCLFSQNVHSCTDVALAGC